MQLKFWNFWKLSHGTYGGWPFDDAAMLESLADRLAYVHQLTGPLANSLQAQGEAFRDNARIGDFFYLTHGNSGIYLLGQFTGPANIFSARGDGWLDRPYRVICKSTRPRKSYDGAKKWWTPNQNSTFAEVPPDELPLFEELILKPYFDIELSKFGIK